MTAEGRSEQEHRPVHAAPEADPLHQQALSHTAAEDDAPAIEPRKAGAHTYLPGLTKNGKRRRKHPVAEVKGGWTDEEDEKLKRLVGQVGEGCWSRLVAHFPGRIGKQLRERWNHELRPDICKLAWTAAEEMLLVAQHRRCGNAWADIAKNLPGRTCNAVKNHWNATLRRTSRNAADRLPQTPLELYLLEVGFSDRPKDQGAPPGCVSQQARATSVARSLDADGHAASRLFSTLSGARPPRSLAIRPAEQARACEGGPASDGDNGYLSSGTEGLDDDATPGECAAAGQKAAVSGPALAADGSCWGRWHCLPGGKLVFIRDDSLQPGSPGGSAVGRGLVEGCTYSAGRVRKPKYYPANDSDCTAGLRKRRAPDTAGPYPTSAAKRAKRSVRCGPVPAVCPPARTEEAAALALLLLDHDEDGDAVGQPSTTAPRAASPLPAQPRATSPRASGAGRLQDRAAPPPALVITGAHADEHAAIARAPHPATSASNGGRSACGLHSTVAPPAGSKQPATTGAGGASHAPSTVVQPEATATQRPTAAGRLRGEAAGGEPQTPEQADRGASPPGAAAAQAAASWLLGGSRIAAQVKDASGSEGQGDLGLSSLPNACQLRNEAHTADSSIAATTQTANDQPTAAPGRDVGRMAILEAAHICSHGTQTEADIFTDALWPPVVTAAAATQTDPIALGGLGSCLDCMGPANGSALGSSPPAWPLPGRPLSGGPESLLACDGLPTPAQAATAISAPPPLAWDLQQAGCPLTAQAQLAAPSLLGSGPASTPHLPRAGSVPELAQTPPSLPQHSQVAAPALASRPAASQAPWALEAEALPGMMEATAQALKRHLALAAPDRGHLAAVNTAMRGENPQVLCLRRELGRAFGFTRSPAEALTSIAAVLGEIGPALPYLMEALKLPTAAE